MRYNRRRTALTMLGMAWGIATVVLLLAYGAGFGRAIEVIFANWGTRIIGVFPGRTSQQAGGQKAGTQIQFHHRRHRPHHECRAAGAIASRPMVGQGVQRAARRAHLHPAHQRRLSQHVQDPGAEPGRRPLVQRGGRRWRAARVAVIGSEAKTKLFSGEYALGQYIRIDGISLPGGRRADARTCRRATTASTR